MTKSIWQIALRVILILGYCSALSIMAVCKVEYQTIALVAASAGPLVQAYVTLKGKGN